MISNRTTIENSKGKSYNIPHSAAAIVSTPSPQLTAALANLKNLKKTTNKQEVHVRPISQASEKLTSPSPNQPVNHYFVPNLRLPAELSSRPYDDNLLTIQPDYDKSVHKSKSSTNVNHIVEHGLRQMKPYYIGKITYVLQPNQFVRPAKQINTPTYYYVPNQQYVYPNYS